jgi:hypothetical protein
MYFFDLVLLGCHHDSAGCRSPGADARLDLVDNSGYLGDRKELPRQYWYCQCLQFNAQEAEAEKAESKKRKEKKERKTKPRDLTQE